MMKVSNSIEIELPDSGLSVAFVKGFDNLVTIGIRHGNNELFSYRIKLTFAEWEEIKVLGN